ncbi:MAG: YggS family pyridoxal phosphate-dependent enzyme [Candidatus Delongbacteria bacterium]|nr:YggS family pyridoxal phosphate-dependent enzyme [Candidatus Delongbacteria bacterium]
MGHIAENLNYLRDDIARELRQSGRPENDVRLIVVSKTVSLEAIREAYRAGARDFGENRIQEALPKTESLDLPEIAWHFIGHLQSNKVNKAVGCFEMIQSVDSLELARRIDQQAGETGTRPTLLLEIKTSPEETKYGYSRDQLMRDLPELLKLDRIRIAGLMTIAEYSDQERRVRQCFQALRRLADELKSCRSDHFEMLHLSMGMSHDYRWAIQEGSTMVRIGSAVFGPRI